jgi:hypothetical protein
VARVSVQVAARRKAPIPFDLGGNDHEYKFTPPKKAELVLPMLDAEDDMEAAREAFAWLDKGMSEEDRDHLAKRLRDPDDDLDIDHVQDLVRLLVEEMGEDPTT